MRALYVEWVDSFSLSGQAWNRRAEVEKENMIQCKTVGFIVKETDDILTLAGTTDGQKGYYEHVAGDMTIPKRAIVKRRVVRWKD